MVRVSLIAVLLCTAAPGMTAPPPGATAAKTVPFTETVHGIAVNDPYRWMESGGTDYDAWLKRQADAADRFLAAIPQRAAILKGIGERTGAIASIGQIADRGDRVFFARRDAGAQTSMLVVRAKGRAERVLFDPASLDTATTKGHAINYWEASPDGRHVFIGASAGGSEEATLRVMDVATGKFVDGEAVQAIFNSISGEFGGLTPHWTGDSRGFFYTRLAEGAKAGDVNYYVNGRLFFHRVGTPFARDRLIMQRGRPGALEMSDAEGPWAFTQPDSRWTILAISDGVGRSQRFHLAPTADAIAGRARWKPIGSRADQIEVATLYGDDVYLVRKDRAKGRIVRLRNGSTDVGTAEEIVPEGADVIEQMVSTKDGLYIVGRNAQGATLAYIDTRGKLQPVALPFAGASYLLDGDNARGGLYLSLENYVTPRERLLIRGTTVSKADFGTKVPFSTDAYVMESVTVRSRDGVMIPVDLVRRKDLSKDGKRPVLVEAYGAYGINVDPGFNPRLYSFLDAGGLIATVHARGGGELGRDWWLGGHKATKPNTWRDVIDSAEWVKASGWTSGKRMTVWGTSAGGIMAGRAVTERPDLWGGVVANVGAMNAMRFEFTPNGKTNIAEFGTVAEPEGAKALYAMDSFAHVKDGIAYPPMFLTAGANDPRVISWQPAKFVARTQAASTGGPVVFKIDYDQGHGMGSMRSQLDERYADVFAFALWAADQER